MPMSEAFHARLSNVVVEAAEHFGTPFHIYDETGIRETGQNLKDAFSGAEGFREFFAVKALPNARILEIMKDMGFGFDCSSIAELVLSRQAGGAADDIFFSSNNTSREEFDCALSEGGSIVNLDSLDLIESLPAMPELACFRYNPGPRRTGNAIIGLPEESKYGLRHDQMEAAYLRARALGVSRFGIHTMLVSKELDYRYMVETTRMLLELAEKIGEKMGVQFEFINIGGGLGIPYRPGESALDIHALGRGACELLERFRMKHGYAPKLFVESGRYMTGPHGVLVTRAINLKDTYRKYIGVDACMSSLMRPAIYGAYHEIGVFGKKKNGDGIIADVVGSLCENNDKFAIQRALPEVARNDLLIIQDTGAHGHAMGFNYNGRLRPKELLLRTDGSVELVRREESLQDLFATLNFKPEIMVSGATEHRQEAGFAKSA